MDNTNNHSGHISSKTKNRTKSLPQPRSSLADKLMGFVALIFFLASVVTAKSDTHRFMEISLINFSLILTSLFLVEVSFRILYIFEELKHVEIRYENSYITLVKDIFHFPPTTGYIFIISFASFVIMGCNYNLWYNFGASSVFTSIISLLCLQRWFKWNSGPLYDSLWIENSSGLDYGSGLAHSFFHGYLKLVIPKTGTSEKHLQELMTDYEDKHKVKLASHKLFILIPKSLYCPTSLMNTEYSPSIEESSSLDEKIITVAGVQNRVYKNSVYKIRVGSGVNRIYICAEYATPLKTFKDVVNYNGEHSNHYKKHKNDIVLQFYLTLEKVLKEHENCKDYCELIFYDDKNEQGGYKDVGQILLRRIKKITKANGYEEFKKLLNKA